jgi:LPS sulfotransferase NodH
VASRFRSFVLFAEMRTGSNFLEANLNALEGVSSYGEVFNPHFIGKKDQTELLGITLEEREADPNRLLARLRDATDGLSGFRYFHDHDPRVLDAVLADPACAKIILTRNPVDSYVSWKIARATGQWKLTDAKRLKSAKVAFDGEEFSAHLAAMQAFQLRLLHGLQTTGQTAFYIDYDDLNAVAVLNGLAAFLGVEARLKAPDDTLKKQNPEDITDKIENPDDMRAALARLDRFNLSRTPNFEPRRPAAIPTSVAAADAPLLFLPVRSGPDAGIRHWLAQLGAGGLIDGFEQKTLRQWKRDHPGHRSFTVLRHPLLRAHVAFREKIVSGQLAEQRRHLITAYKADLPNPGDPFPDTEAEREAFAIFLHYAKLGTSGQTGLRVDPNWASQTAIMQGIAGFQPLDLILREDRLAEGLAYLAAEIGVAAPVLHPHDAAETALAAIHDDRLEHAAEAAYHRDYMGFGFGRWRV